MKKETGYFENYIASKQKTICDIRMNKHFSEKEKLDLIRTYNSDIDTLHRIEAAIAHRELRRTKESQYIKLKRYETLITN